MAATGTQAQDLTGLYETYFANAERLTEEIDRLAAELENTHAHSRDARIMLKNVSRIAEDLSAQAQVLAETRAHAAQIATDAGQSAARSLTEHAGTASDRLCQRLNESAGAVERTTAGLRHAVLLHRAWSGFTVALALVAMTLGAYGMHWFQKHLAHEQAASEQDIYLRSQGMLLQRMAADANKKEAAVLTALYRRSAQKVAAQSGAGAQR